MKCIHVTFDNVDYLDFCIYNLKNEYNFSYSFLDSVEENAPDSFVQNNSINPFGFISFVPFSFSNSGLPFQGIDEKNHYSANDKKIVSIRIKCRDIDSDNIVCRLYNLNGRNISVT